MPVNRDIIDTLIAEAAGEGPEGMRRVAETILNRAAIRGLTPEQVVRQPAQYTGYWDPGPGAVRSQRDAATRAAAEAAWELAQQPGDPTGGADHYYAHGTIDAPYWAGSMTPRGQYGGHTFLSSRPIPPGEIPQVASALDVIERVAPRPANQSSAMGYARATTPSAFAPPPAPMPRPERTRSAPVPASVEQRVTARNSQVSAPPPMPRSPPTAPKTEIYTGPSVPIGLMMLADTPNAATPRLQSNGSVRSPMAMPPTPASVEQRVTARNNPPPAPPTPRSRPPRTYGESNLIADSFNAQSAAARPELQTALNQKYGPTGIGAMPSFASLQNFAGTNVPERLTAGIDQVTAYPRPTQVAQTPPLPRARPQTGIGGPLPPIAPPMPPAVQPVAPVGPKIAPVPAPRLQRPGIFGTPKIGNWEVPLPGILGTVQNITAAMNNAGGPFNNGADNLLYNAMRGGNFASPGGGVAQSAGFRYAQGPNGWVNVGAVNPDLTPAQRYTLANAANRGLSGPSTQGNWLATSGGAGASESSGEGNYTPWMAPGSTAERLAKLKEQHSK